MPRPMRSNSETPSSASKSRSALETAACDMNSLAAASRMFGVLAKAKKISRYRSVMNPSCLLSVVCGKPQRHSSVVTDSL